MKKSTKASALLLVAGASSALATESSPAAAGWTDWVTTVQYSTIHDTVTNIITVTLPPVTQTKTDTVTETKPVTFISTEVDTVTQTETDTVTETKPVTVISTEVDTVTETAPPVTVVSTEVDTVTQPVTVVSTEVDTITLTAPVTVISTEVDTVTLTAPVTVVSTEVDTVTVTAPVTVLSTTTEVNQVTVTAPVTIVSTVTQTAAVTIGETVSQTVSQTLEETETIVQTVPQTVSQTVQQTVEETETIVNTATVAETIVNTATVATTATQNNVITVTITSISAVTQSVSVPVSISYCPSPTLTGLVTCPPRIVNPTYTTSTPLPSNYLWGCPPGKLCYPKRENCNFEQNPPADTYYCAPEECRPVSPLPPIDNYPTPDDVNGTCAWLPVVDDYFNINPIFFGLNFGIFDIYGQPTCTPLAPASTATVEVPYPVTVTDAVNVPYPVTVTDSVTIIETPIAVSSPVTIYPSGWGVWGSSSAPPQVTPRADIAERDLVKRVAVPSECYAQCNFAQLVYQSIGPNPPLCESTGSYSSAYDRVTDCTNRFSDATGALSVATLINSAQAYCRANPAKRAEAHLLAPRQDPSAPTTTATSSAASSSASSASSSGHGQQITAPVNSVAGLLLSAFAAFFI